jgi:hypothetical protein
MKTRLLIRIVVDFMMCKAKNKFGL